MTFVMHITFLCLVGTFASARAQATGFIGIKPVNKDLGEFYATFDAEGQSVTVHDKSMVGMDSVGRRTWSITTSPAKPGTVVISSLWIDESEPQGWVARERLTSIRSPVRWVDINSVYEAGEYNNAGFRLEKNPRPFTFDSQYITPSTILPPLENILMTAPGQWEKPKFYMCVSHKNYHYWTEDAEDEKKANPAHWGWSGATLNLDALQPESYCEPVGVYVLAYPDPTNKKIKFD
ncbi:hypothetical protein H072_35 [Dactylellina haptotyla CBS 200.50]|uniref:Enterotoxin n=1 Tax=Dactylellina haptotyla (strain CBS 200.50) TaxID=1284197 RepID=S8ASI5_DACHA|nr:hypothetical protein H072_35 [Dactylellina haptotyla CBS 200.50]